MIPLFDRNPTERKPVVTRLLIYANIIVFIITWWIEAHGTRWIAPGYGMVPARVTADPAGEAVKLLSSAFLHAGGAHLGWNMLFLHIFGDNVEDALGKARYLLFYMVCALVGGLAQYLLDPYSSTPLVGASGAIAGILGGYMVLYPRAPVIVFNPLIFPFPLLPLPAWLVVGWWFITNLAGSLVSVIGAASQIAYMAHLGGFAAGLLLIRGLYPQAQGKTESTGGFRQTTHQAKSRVFPRDREGPFWR